MKHTFFTIAAALCLTGIFAQPNTGAGFENAVLDSGKVINGSAGDTLFTETDQGNQFKFPIYWNTQFNFWEGGWAISRKYDSSTVASDFSKHLYCNKGFKGYNNSNTFAIGSNYAWFVQKGSGAKLSGVYINNCTYTYNSMMFGDQFAKKFGGVSGHDSDYLLLTAMHYEKGMLIDTSEIYLGDYRSSDSTKDHLLKDWTFLRLSGDSIVFVMSGTDTGQFGLNTPAYFAIDGVEAHVASAKKVAAVAVNIYPNPAKDQVHIQAAFPIRAVAVSDLLGHRIQQQLFPGNSNQLELNIQALSPGIYFLQVATSKGIGSEKLIISER